MATGARVRIEAIVLTWEHVEAHSHQFGGIEYRIGRREIGHIHGDGLVDIPFPKKIRDEVVASGLAQAHHILPESGWVSLYLREDADIARALDLLQRSYQIAITQKNRGLVHIEGEGNA